MIEPDDDAIEPLPELLQQGDWMRSFAQSLVADPHLAEDLVQETMLVALTARGIQRGRGWWARVMRNTARNHWRSERTRSDHESRSFETSEAVAIAAEGEATNRDVCGAVRAALAALAEPYRSTLVSRYMRGQTSVEIARATGVPEGTVRWRIKRGLASLREQLDGEFEGGRWEWMPALALAYPGIHGAAVHGSGSGQLVGPGPKGRSARVLRGSGVTIQGSGLWLSLAAALLVGAMVGGLAWLRGARGDGVVVGQLQELGALTTGDVAALPLGSIGAAVPVASPDAVGPDREVAVGAVEVVEPVAGSIAASAEPGLSLPAARWSLQLFAEDKATRLPVPGARIQVVTPGASIEVGQTDAEGRAGLYLDDDDFVLGNVALQDDSISVQLLAEDYSASFVHTLNREVLELAAKGTLVIPMEPSSGQLRGCITDDEGIGLAGASVTVDARSGGYRFEAQPGFMITQRFLSTITDSEGRYSIDHVTTEPLIVRVSAPGFITKWVDLEVMDGQAQAFDTRLERGRKLSGAVVDEGGSPVAGAKVWADPRTTAFMHSSFTQPSFVPRLRGFTHEFKADGDGRFEIGGLQEGVTRIWAQHPSQPELVASMDFDSAVGERQTWTPVLARREALRLRAVGLDGEPTRGMVLYLSTAKSMKPRWERYLYLDEDGYAELYDWLERPFDVSLIRADMAVAPVAEREDLTPTPGELIVVREAAAIDVRFFGRVTMADGAQAPEGIISCVDRCRKTPRDYGSRIRGEDGTFDTRVPVGVHHLRVDFAEMGCLELDPVDFMEGMDVEQDVALPGLVQLEAVTSTSDGVTGTLPAAYLLRAHTDLGSPFDARLTMAQEVGAPAPTRGVLPGLYSMKFFREDGTTWGALVHAPPECGGRYAAAEELDPFVLLDVNDVMPELLPGWTLAVRGADGEWEPLTKESPPSAPEHAPGRYWYVQLAEGSHGVAILNGEQPVAELQADVTPFGVAEVLRFSAR